MTKYTEAQRNEDSLSLKNALQQIDQIRALFSDVIVIPEVITIQDVMAIALDTTKGPQKIGDVCTREEIGAILRAFEDNACADPVLVAQYTLNDYRQANPVDKE